MTQKEKAAPSFAAAPEVYTSDLPSAKLDNFSETRKDLGRNVLDDVRAQLDADANEAAESGRNADTRENRFRAFLARGWFDDLDENITRPNFRFNIMGVDCVPAGEIIAVAGKPGAGKSTTLAILIGILIGATEFAGIRCLTPCKKVLWIDTEKGAYSCRQKMRNFRRVANLGDDLPLTDIGIFFKMMRQDSTADRLYFIDQLAAMEKYDAIVIDGVFDLTDDPDKELSGVTDLLKNLAQTGASVFAMLHTNKAENDNNMRYALGTELQRLCTTRVTIKFDAKTKRHTIEIDKSNDTALPPEVSFMFDNGGSVIPLSQHIDTKATLLYVFRDGQSRDWRKLRADFSAKSGATPSEAFSCLQEAQSKGWLTPELDGSLNIEKDYF